MTYYPAGDKESQTSYKALHSSELSLQYHSLQYENMKGFYWKLCLKCHAFTF